MPQRQSLKIRAHARARTRPPNAQERPHTLTLDCKGGVNSLTVPAGLVAAWFRPGSLPLDISLHPVLDGQPWGACFVSQILPKRSISRGLQSLRKLARHQLLAFRLVGPTAIKLLLASPPAEGEEQRAGGGGSELKQQVAASGPAGSSVPACPAGPPHRPAAASPLAEPPVASGKAQQGESGGGSGSGGSSERDAAEASGNKARGEAAAEEHEEAGSEEGVWPVVSDPSSDCCCLGPGGHVRITWRLPCLGRSHDGITWWAAARQGSQQPV